MKRTRLAKVSAVLLAMVVVVAPSAAANEPVQSDEISLSSSASGTQAIFASEHISTDAQRAMSSYAPEAWVFVRKIGSAPCFELMRNGPIYGLTNVCANNGGETRYIKNVSFGGGRHSVCIGQHQMLTLGVQGEWAVSGPDAWPAGCRLKSAPYIVHSA